MSPQKTGWLVPSGKRLHNYGKSPFSMGKSTISTGSFSMAQTVNVITRPGKMFESPGPEFTGRSSHPWTTNDSHPALKFKLHEHADGIDNNQQAHHQFLHRLPVELSF